ncbi:MAG: NAD(P)-dependent oxidoreductase [Candidatus Aminicenantes bacterium]|nr:NAD(P)-dependent oxidoreductase [Candidatus Aminicenantes bacterium]
MVKDNYIVDVGEPVLVTGSSGFIGRRVVENLILRGFNKVRCLVRETSDIEPLKKVINSYDANDRIEIVRGNLFSKDECKKITEKIKVIFHLAAGTRTKSFSEAFLNSVVTTRNLIEAVIHHSCIRRFVNVSSFSVYTNIKKKTGKILDEACPVEDSPETRAEAYCYGKVKQDELVMEYGKKMGLPYVIVRPGTVYGPGKNFIPGRVGIDSFGIFLHFGGSNPLPLTYVENCAEAIVLSGLVPGIEGEVFNIVDDNLPTSREFLWLYKKHVDRLKSIYVPKPLGLLFCILWEKFAKWSQGQLPPAFSYREWAAYWKKTQYSNRKIKQRLGWQPKVTTSEGLEKFFAYCSQIKKK